MKIVVLDGHAVNPGDLSWDFLKEFGEVTVHERTPEEKVAQYIGDAEIALINKAPITRQVIEACPQLRLICVLATGYNVVDLPAARERGIAVCNVPGYSTEAVAQFTFALLLELCHHVGHHSRVVHGGKWTSCPDFCFWDMPQLSLAGKTLGIIGFGSIGRAVAAIAKAFGMEVLAYSRTERPEHAHLAQYVDLDTLLSRSDVVSLHCPLTEQTKGLIGRENLAKMRPGAMLINTARGPVLDEAAVADALRSGKLGGAAMDVVCKEPIPGDSLLLGAPNCVITPHIAWAPMECRQRIIATTTESIRGFLAGKSVNTV